MIIHKTSQDAINVTLGLLETAMVYLNAARGNNELDKNRFHLFEADEIELDQAIGSVKRILDCKSGKYQESFSRMTR